MNHFSEFLVSWYWNGIRFRYSASYRLVDGKPCLHLPGVI